MIAYGAPATTEAGSAKTRSWNAPVLGPGRLEPVSDCDERSVSSSGSPPSATPRISTTSLAVVWQLSGKLTFVSEPVRPGVTTWASCCCDAPPIVRGKPLVLTTGCAWSATRTAITLLSFGATSPPSPECPAYARFGPSTRATSEPNRHTALPRLPRPEGTIWGVLTQVRC